MTNFKKGQTVYFGTLKGHVRETDSRFTWKNKTYPIYVVFENEANFYFTEDGRLFYDTPILLTDYPCEFEYKEVVPQIEKDTVVWFRDNIYHPWTNGFYSHFENGMHYCFNESKKSTETDGTSPWKIVTTKNPLI